MIFQGPSLLRRSTVVENVALPLLLAGWPRRHAVPAAARARSSGSALDAGGASCPRRSPAARRSASRSPARSPAGPALILADEPTSQLDRASGARVVEVLLEAARRSGAALVVATHDEAVAARLDERWDGRRRCLRTAREARAC